MSGAWQPGEKTAAENVLATLRRQQKQIDELTACIGNLAQRVHELEGIEEKVNRLAGVMNDAVVRDRERLHDLEKRAKGLEEINEARDAAGNPAGSEEACSWPNKRENWP